MALLGSSNGVNFMFHEGVSPVLPIILEKAVKKEANRTMNPSFHTVGWEGLH